MTARPNPYTRLHVPEIHAPLRDPLTALSLHALAHVHNDALDDHAAATTDEDAAAALARVERAREILRG